MKSKQLIWIALLGVSLLVTGCSSDDKPPLKGERISVLEMQNSLSVDEQAKEVPLNLPEAMDNTAWPQAGGNATHAPQHVALSDTISRKWREDIGEGSEDDRKLITPPVMADGKIFAANTEGDVYAFTSDNGKKLWEVNVWGDDDDSSVVSPGLAYGAGMLFVTDGIGNVLALDPKDGKKIWSQDTGSSVRGAPTVQGENIYVTTLSDETIAFDANTGNVVWRYQGMHEDAGILVGVSPAAEGSVIISTYSSGDVVAIRAETGQEAWSDNLTGAAEFQKRAVTTLSAFRGHPVLDADHVIVGNSSTRLAAINVPTGERVWQKEFGVVSTPWIAGNMLFALSSQSELVGMIKGTGQVRWTLALPRYEDPKDKEDLIFWNGPVLASGKLYIVGSHEEMLVVDPDNGKIIRKYDLPGKVMLPPIVANKTLYVLTDNGTLAAYK